MLTRLAARDNRRDTTPATLGERGDSCYKAGMRIVSFMTCVLFLTFGACSKPQETEPAAAPQAVQAPASDSARVNAPPSPHAPTTATGNQPASDNATAGGLHFHAPKPFVARQPKSRMRAAEYGLESDGTSELAVFYFGADQGGSVEDNMTRWIGQFKKPDGSDADAKRGERTAHGIPISTVEAIGTYNGGMGMPGAAAPTPQADAMLLGAIAKGPEGAVFFKLTGPRASLENARPAFDQLLESIAH